MRALLDTHTFLWAVMGDQRLSKSADTILRDASNQIYLSAVCALEIAIKSSIGRLTLPASVDTFIGRAIQRFTLVELPVSIAHSMMVARLPHHHADPFDRLLVAQAQAEALPIVTSDPQIARYNVDVIW